MLERTAATGAASLVAAHARTDRDEALLDPQVFIVDAASIGTDDASLLEELVGLCTPQSGAALVIVGDHPSAHERVRANSVDDAAWSGAHVRPVVLDREAVAQVAVMFDHAANAPAEPLTPTAVVADCLAADRLADEADATSAETDSGVFVAEQDDEVAAYRYEPPPHDVLVQVLGSVTVHGRPITAAADVELLCLLAFKRDDRPNVDTIRFLLGRTRLDAHGDEDLKEPARKTLHTRISSLRSKLGFGADNQPLLPTATDGEAGKGRYTVSSRVLTDVDLIEHRFHTARQLASGDALPVLRDGLSLFNGPAFRGTRKGYDWAPSEMVLAKVANIVNAYTTLLMQLAFDNDDIALVLETAKCGGRVVDDPIAFSPVQDVQRQMAEASADPDLAEAVLEAHRRLLAHAEQYDPLGGS